MPTDTQEDILDDPHAGDDLHGYHDGTWQTTQSDVAAKLGVYKVPIDGSGSDTNGILGAYTQPPNTGVLTDTEIPRAFGTGFSTGKLYETTLEVAIEHRISALSAWGVSAGDNNNDFGLILRASGVKFGADQWYEIGITDLDTQSNAGASIEFRRIRDGVSTTLETKVIDTISGTWSYPGWNEGAIQNQWSVLRASCENIVTGVRLKLRIEVPSIAAIEWTFDDTSSSRITTPGYGGFYATGNAASVDSLWHHFQNFELTATYTAQVNPDDAYTMPELEVDAALTPIAVLGEGSAVSSLPIEPTYAVTTQQQFWTALIPFEAGYAQTFARFQTSRRRWELQFENLTQNDEATLRSFFNSHYGATHPFTWTPPDGSATKVYFVGPSMESRFNDVAPSSMGSHVRSTSAVLEELF
jgi:phage-related protein